MAQGQLYDGALAYHPGAKLTLPHCRLFQRPRRLRVIARSWHSMRPTGTFRGRPQPRSARLAEQALARGALLDDETSAGLSFYLATFALAFGEALHMAEAALTAAIEDAQSRGSVLGFAIASRLRARPILMRGRLGDAPVDVRRALAAEPATGRSGAGQRVLSSRAVMLEQGDLERARRYLDQADAVADPGDRLRIWLLSARGRLEFTSGDPAAALKPLPSLRTDRRESRRRKPGGRRMARPSPDGPWPLRAI